jgi:glycosyltransferase involved in cell wall biosynthesis
LSESKKERKRIAVNARLLQDGKLEGLGVFTDELLKRLTRSHPEVEFILLFDRPFHKRFIYSSNCTAVQLPPPTRHPLLWRCWLEITLPLYLRRKKIDVFLSLDGFGLPKSTFPQIIAIHDLNFLHRPEDLPASVAQFYNRFFPRFACTADEVLTVSDHSKRDLASSYGLPLEKIHVAANALPEQRSWETENQPDPFSRLTSGAPYFAYIGAIHKRKNLARLMAAFQRFVAGSGSDHHLIIAGEATGHYRKEWALVTSSIDKSRIHLTGRLTEKEKYLLLGGAQAMVCPSLYEGFGIPILEAFSAGTPVLCSNRTSLPEVAGDAALLFDPDSETEMCACMEQISTSDGLRVRLVGLGKERLQHYSWERSAEVVWKVIESCLQK